jgi:hypothetical protein
MMLMVASLVLETLLRTAGTDAVEVEGEITGFIETLGDGVEATGRVG